MKSGTHARARAGGPSPRQDAREGGRGRGSRGVLVFGIRRHGGTSKSVRVEGGEAGRDGVHAVLPLRPSVQVLVKVARLHAPTGEAALRLLALAWGALPGALRLRTVALARLCADGLAPGRVAYRLALWAIAVVAMHGGADDSALRGVA